MAHLLYKTAEIGSRIGYRRAAKRNNARALAMRLARTEHDGWPLPTGKKGELRITVAQQLTLPAKSFKDLDRIYKERAQDLHVDISVMHESNSQDLIVQWSPNKTPVHKAHY
jgi:hypothetical protein